MNDQTLSKASMPEVVADWLDSSRRELADFLMEMVICNDPCAADIYDALHDYIVVQRDRAECLTLPYRYELRELRRREEVASWICRYRSR